MVVIGPAAVWLFGGWLAISGGLKIGVIVAFVAYLGRLYTPASALAGVQVQIVSAFAVFERIFSYLDMAPEVEKPDARVLGEVSGEVTFDDVHFSYTPERTAVRWRRSWDHRAPARRPLRSWFRASTTRRAARSASTASTCAT
jgi:ATP-binding cassette subfamily B protein